MKCPDCNADNCVNNDYCIKCNQPMIGQEVELMNKIANVWNFFINMETLHPDENKEFQKAIHDLQNKVSYRIAKRLTAKEDLFN